MRARARDDRRTARWTVRSSAAGRLRRVLAPTRATRANVDDEVVRWDVVRRRAETVVNKALNGADAAKALRKALRGELNNEERRAIARCALGCEVWRIRLAAERASALRSETGDVLATYGRFDRSDAAGALVFTYWLRDRGGSGPTPGKEEMFRMYGDGVDACAAATEEDTVEWSTDGAMKISELSAIPVPLAEMFVRDYGDDEALRLARAMNEPGPVMCRANVARCSVEECAERLEQDGLKIAPARFATHAFALVNGAPANGGIFGVNAWREGWFEVQDEGSQLIVAALEAKAGERVLDACAGNGGKTLAIAAEMKFGEVCVFDIDRRRLAHLEANAERAGSRDMVTTVQGTSLQDLAPHSFDAVLVDAPCSSVGALRRTPSLRHMHDDPNELAKIQLGILREAAALVKPGGRLVYATCSVLSFENHEVVRAFESEFADIYEPLPFDDAFIAASRERDREHERSLLPHLHGTDGFFIARFRNRSNF